MAEETSSFIADQIYADYVGSRDNLERLLHRHYCLVKQENGLCGQVYPNDLAGVALNDVAKQVAAGLEYDWLLSVVDYSYMRGADSGWYIRAERADNKICVLRVRGFELDVCDQSLNFHPVQSFNLNDPACISECVELLTNWECPVMLE